MLKIEKQKENWSGCLCRTKHYIRSINIHTRNHLRKLPEIPRTSHLRKKMKKKKIIRIWNSCIMVLTKKFIDLFKPKKIIQEQSGIFVICIKYIYYRMKASEKEEERSIGRREFIEFLSSTKIFMNCCQLSWSLKGQISLTSSNHQSMNRMDNM